MKKIFIAILVFFSVGFSEPLEKAINFVLLTEEEVDSIGNFYMKENGHPEPPGNRGFTFEVESESEPGNVLFQIAPASDTLNYITLLDTALFNGVYEYRWKYDNLPFETGMYFYRFQIGDTSFVKRMIIVR